jgi:NTP pyrophosphatase (non-canonical NTP hydrolase)
MKDDKKELTLKEYQKQAMTTCMSTSKNFSYMFLNLVGEVGELASKIAKHIRKDKAIIHTSRLELYDVSNKENEELMKEAGDILWQLSGLCTVMGWDLEDVARTNLSKLASRKERNVIDGNGDNR